LKKSQDIFWRYLTRYSIFGKVISVSWEGLVTDHSSEWLKRPEKRDSLSK